MKINIQPIDCTPRQDLLDLVNEKLEKLAHFSDRILECKVVLRIEKADKRDNKVVEVRFCMNQKFQTCNAACFCRREPLPLRHRIVEWPL